MRKTKFSLMTAALASVLLVAGCGSNNSNNADNSPSSGAASPSANAGGQASAQANDEPVKLKAWIMPNSPQPDKDFLSVMDPYLKEHQNVKLEVTVLDWGSAWTKITTAATSGEGPDILQLGTTWVPAIASMGGIDKITDKVGDVGGEGNYLPASWNTTRIAGQSDIYGVPWFVDARAIYYNTEAFKAASVDPAEAFKTWDSFKAALQKVNGVEVNGQKMAALGIPGKNDWNVVHNIFPWIWANGGNALGADNTTVEFNSDQGVDGVMYYTGLAKDGLVDKSSLEKNTAQIEGDFADGKIAVMISGPWMIKNFATPTDAGGQADKVAAKQYGVAPLPAGPAGQSTFIGGSNLTVFSGSKNKDAAWQVIKYLSTEEAQKAYSGISGQLPAAKSLIESPDMEAGFKAFAEATKYGKSYPSIPQWGALETALQKHFSNIWDIVAGVSGTYDKDSIKKELDSAAAEVESIIQQ